MAITVNDRDGRQKILEGLWLIGIEPGQLAVSPDQPTNAFLESLHRNGVNDDFIRRAIAGVDWRKGDTTVSQNIADLLRASGYRTDEVQRFLDTAARTGAANDPAQLMRVLTEQFNERTAGAMVYKATGGKDVAGAVWNPFRTDTPPKNADLKFGGGGVLATNLPAGMSATEPRNPLITGAPGQRLPPSATAGVPTPPSSVRRTPGPAAPQAGAAPGAGAGGGAGSGGGLNVNDAVSNPATWSDDQIKDFIKANFGANAWFIDIPEVWEALRGVVKAGKGVGGLEPALETTAFWKQNNAAARNWFARSKADPAQTAADIAQQAQALGVMAQKAGLQIDPARLRQIAESSLRYGWTNADMQQALAAEFHYDPNTKDQAAIVGTVKQKARNWLVPISDQAIQTWGQGLLGGTTTDEAFTQYLRDNAKSLFPQLASMIDAHAGDPNFTVDTFVDPYRAQAANLLGIQDDQIDFMDPKWRRPLDTIDPKTGERRIMSQSEWVSTLKSDKQYGYDKTQNGINEALNLAQSLTKSMGF